MYSFILMTAMTGSPQTAEFNGFFRDLFGFRGGCHGSCSGSRSESAGCTGSRSSSGCSGSCHGDRPARAYAGGSCYGSCSGRSSSGSSCCGGSLSYASCGGGSGGSGGMSPGFAEPGVGGMGMFATPSPAASYYTPMEGGGSCFGTGAPAPFTFPESGGGYAQPSATPPSSVREYSPRADQLPPPSSGQGDASRATVVVRLPADATLFAEGRRLSLVSDTRRFVSPPLPSSSDYTYNFRVEYARNGETISRTKSVSVRAGGQFSVDFDETLSGRPASLAPQQMPASLPTTTRIPTVPMPAATAPVGVPNPVPGKAAGPERAKITVKLSRGATLYVDGRKNDRTETVREFTTPPLAQGAEYAYLLKAEISRNGQPESQTVKVTFRAGEIQTVDLTQWPTGTERAGN